MMYAISVLLKPASGLCNMSCDYCFYADEIKNRDRDFYGMMELQTLKNVVRKTMLNAKHTAAFAFQGGEPTLRGLDFFREVIALENKYNRRHIQVQNSLQTNGFAIDEEWCRFLRDHHFLVGLSVDGTADTHNCYRHDAQGGDTFQRILHTAQLFDRYRIDYNILTVVNQRVARDIEEIYAFYKRNQWRYLQFIPCLDPLNQPWGNRDFSITPEEYGDFLVRLFSLWRSDLAKGQAPYIRQFENYLGLLCGYLPEACDQRGVCGIQYVVEADGSVYPCDFYVLDAYCIGNINNNTFAEIHTKGMEIGFIERSRNISAECKACSYFSLCRGGCQRNRQFQETTGSYENYFCKSYRYFFDHCLDSMKGIVRDIKTNETSLKFDDAF